MWNTIVKLLKDVGFDYLLAGVVLLVLGAVGRISFSSFALEIPSVVFRSVLVIVGILLILSSIVYVVRTHITKDTRSISVLGKGVKITKPGRGQGVHGEFVVEGVYQKRPSRDEDVRLFVSSIDRDNIWPQAKVVFNEDNNSWKGTVNLWDEPPKQAYISIVSLGTGSGVLCDYYGKAGFKSNAWVPLDKLTKDAHEYHCIVVVNSPIS